MAALAPWMHPFEFGPQTYTGYFKYDGLGTELTWVNPQSPAAEIERVRAAYQRQSHVLWPKFVEELVADIPPGERQSSTVLDAGAGTGRNSLIAVDLGFGRVLASEIRASQSAQLQLILDCAADHRYRSHISVINDPVSADDAAYPERYREAGVDIVFSFGLLYHLANPVQHLANVRRVARRRAIIYTMTHFHPFAKRMWWLQLEAGEWITKAVSGVSWTPHYLEVPRLCRALGFSRVRMMYPEIFANHFRNYATPSRATDAMLAGAMLLDRIARIKAGPLRNHDFGYFRHTQLNPNYFAYICDV